LIAQTTRLWPRPQSRMVINSFPGQSRIETR
jgi:hypothetical protein